ncbi:hypothetical protein LTR36_006171 [Oleoguttula mirabilis]|uniref:histidine kinase n=1 Tax=Oleoguttula mirabilis TaxID=1507867 RepID=A0AAV9JD93_9PEZI|nr:hypothetical protein LTR36_006171 [Oleoguttula mirabilis]
MRISIRSQLGLLILLSSLIGVAVVSIATWVSNHNFVLSIRSSRLSLTASLKAAQLASNLNLMQTSANFVTTRVLIQSALRRYAVSGNNTAENWVAASSDMDSAISGGGSLGQSLLAQTQVFPADATGPAGSYSVLNTTSDSVNGTLTLPYLCDDGSQAVMGTGDCGYPPMLYPNLTYISQHYNSTYNVSDAVFDGDMLGPDSALLLGPWAVNSSLSFISLTLPMINNTSSADVLGWLTTVMDATLIQQVISATEGLDKTGETLLVGPTSTTNVFPADVLYTRSNGSAPKNFNVKYVFPLAAADAKRHPNHIVGTANPPFSASKFPAIASVFTKNSGAYDNSGAMIKTHNENGDKVSVGYAMPQSGMVNWAILVSQARSEVWQPINRLRDILLACVFATAVFMAVIAFPLAHFLSLPIRRLREATAKSIEPPGATPSRSSMDSYDYLRDGARDLPEDDDTPEAVLAQKEGFINPVSKWRQRRNEDRDARREARRRRVFKIPGKVRERKTLLKDELSDLTSTFNEMSDELMMQYEKLEERVQQRTAELELSKKAAESANESKTLFIANISHELKTPLNGILGMAAVCMQEDDPVRLKRSLGIIYKSGDLLLNLLTDLLTFSKNQVGQHLSLDEKEFRLRDISSQVLAIFDKQAKEGQIDLRVEFQGCHGLLDNDNVSPERQGGTDYGPSGTGRLKDMILWGDTHRILQVVINLVSNALKFTPAGGAVVVVIRCLPDAPELNSRKTSLASKQSRQSRQRSSRHKESDVSLPRLNTANAINAKDRPHAMMHRMSSDRATSPPPGRYLYFEFEVQDTGPGIPESSQQMIFEPFVQGDLGLSKKFGGTGLGLAICSQLASLMRGTICVKSAVDQGSTFTMKLPLRHLQTRADSTASSSVDLLGDGMVSRSQSQTDGERTPARRSRHLAEDRDGTPNGTSTEGADTNGAVPPELGTDSQPRLVGLSQPYFASSQPMESPESQPGAMKKITDAATRGGRIRVLVAEDNKVNQEVVLRMLKLEDIYDVTVAKDGQEALDRVQESMQGDGKPYNLIFMDVQMPNVDGLQSTRLIREIGYQAPIVALTAFAEESNIKDCMDSGMNYFLSKPIRRPQLKKVLKQYIAPIPEESEEVTPPDVQSGSLNTTIVMVNNGPPDGHTEGQHPPAVIPRKPADEEPPLGRTETSDEAQPVSPLTTI